MNLKLQLKILSFLQFCLWGSWLTTLGSYMFVTLKFDGAAIGAVYSSLGIAAVLMPTLLGIVADKWISAKWVYAICHLVGALTLYLAAQVTTPGEMFLVILLNSLAYMPTLGLINTISYYRLPPAVGGAGYRDRFPANSYLGHHRLYPRHVGRQLLGLRA
jgi:NHS family nucleoside permease-like MFS transporter